MDAADQHTEIELNFINRGELTFRHGPNEFVMPQGSAILYWAAIPHQVTVVAPATDIFWSVIPLSWFLSWNLKSGFSQRLLEGELFWLGRDAPKQLSQMPIARWVRDFETGSLEFRKIIELEMEAFFRRLALEVHSCREATSSKGHLPRHEENYRVVQKMVRFITEHATDSSLTIDRVAEDVGLSSEYAMRIFRKDWGMTIWTFLLQQRVSHAKRLLVLEDAKVVDIAFQCGFGSVSRFYSAFNRHCHCSPLAFRQLTLEGGPR